MEQVFLSVRPTFKYDQVIPAEAGIQSMTLGWTPAYVGETKEMVSSRPGPASSVAK